MKKKNKGLTIFLMKESATEFNDVLKKPRELVSASVKPYFDFDASIYYCDSNKNVPKWKRMLDEFADEKLNIGENSSNKAIMLVKVRERIMALVFGYGRSFLKEEYIVKNFGLKVALNIIEPSKMRSVDSDIIEDMVVKTQKQASYSTSQDEFNLNVSTDIMKSVYGECYDEKYGKNVTGKDSLRINLSMEPEDLLTKLELYYDAYGSKRYQEIGFDWIDNIAEIKDLVLVKNLNDKLVSAIQHKNTKNLYVAPPVIIDFDSIIGFCFGGMGLNIDDEDEYEIDLNIIDYLETIKENIDVFSKIKRDRIFGMSSEGSSYPISNIYNSLIFQTSLEENEYVLSAGSWYRIDKLYFDKVNHFIENNVKISDIHLPNCKKDMVEGKYNEYAVSTNSNYCLMDCKLVGVEQGPRQIESCDIFTKDKQFIHVKNKGSSAQLSHLFSQGKVAAVNFASDVEFRKQVANIIYEQFKENIFDYKEKPKSREYEVIYAIIDKVGKTIQDIPFFSKVNLMLSVQELERMHYKSSVCMITKEE